MLFADLYTDQTDRWKDKMKYRKLELLLLALGVTAVLASILLSFSNKTQLSEIIGQALFVPVLFLALHYGRSYGYVSAILAAFVYLVARVQEFDSLSLTTFDGQLVVARAGLFGLIGIFGGELAMRIKYVVARFADEDLIDGHTNVFSCSYLQRSVHRLLCEYYRYQRPFSLLVVSLRWHENLNSPGKAKIIPRIAKVISDNVRVVDEVGYLDEDRFCLVLPNTPSPAAQIVCNRLEKSYRHFRDGHHIPAELEKLILSLPEDEQRIKDLLPENEPAKVLA